MARRTTGERAAHKARRGSIRAANKAAASNCGTSGFNAQMTAAQWAAFWSPAAVTARQRAAVRQARQQAAAAKAFAAFARKSGFKPTPFKPFTAAQMAKFFATCNQQQRTAMKPPHKPAKAKHKSKHRHHAHIASRRPARAQRALRPTRRPGRPRRPRATRAVRARR